MNEPKILSEADYDELAFQLADSDYPKAVLSDFRHPYIKPNRKFYPMILDALERLRKTKPSLAPAISNAIELVNDQNDYVETDLPDWVINDHHNKHYLKDHLSVHRPGELEKFHNWIIQRANELGNEGLDFLEWCRAKLEINYALHKKKCQEPLTCDVNKSYERRLLFVRNLLDRLEPDEEESIEDIPSANFQLNEDKGHKIDFIRVINAMYAMGFFQPRTGRRLAKITVMKTFGQLLGTDLSNYDKDLSQSFQNGSLESNVQIFKDLEELTKDIYLEKQNNF
ncbi:MAG: hypothetical protein R3D58_17090 [Saprospiraceae bacterium]